MNLLFLQFNNYFNRFVKKYNTVEDYISHSSNHSQYGSKEADGSNFNPNDGINTERTLNWAEKWNPDYLVCFDSENTIVSRWFIIRPRRRRSGQYFLTLRRDVVAEKYDNILNAPCFIQKGFVSPENPLIFNKEDFNCNQIKKNEKTLHDNTGCCWLVAYYNLSEKANLKGDVTDIEEEYIDTGSADLASWPLYQRYGNIGYIYDTNKQFAIEVDASTTVSEVVCVFNNNCEMIDRHLEMSLDTGLEYDTQLNIFNNDDPNIISTTSNGVKECIDSNKNSISTALENYRVPVDTLEDFTKYNGKIIKTNDGNFYRVSIVPNETQQYERYLPESSVDAKESALILAIQNSFKIGGIFKNRWSGNFNKAIRYVATQVVYTITCIPITNAVNNVHFDFSSVQDVTDAPYGILAFPFRAIEGQPIKYNNEFLDMNMPLKIIKELTKDGIGAGNKIFDVQILPYCPVTSVARLGYNLYFGDTPANYYSIISDNNSVNKTIAVHPTSCKFTFNIFSRIEVKDEIKVENQIRFYRICSPNWSAIYEFSVAKNEGVDYFNVDCTYKPYQPYIHLNPNYKGLYGSDFNDARGLVCGGDFSISSVSSAFENYQLQNKSFQEMFNRQIDSMDVMHKYNMIEQSASALTGIGAGAMSGMFLTGNPAGAIGGGIASAVGGGADLLLSQKRFSEQRDLAIDMHNFNIQNIKARPDTLTKVTAFNNNNKMWPILEEYSCTDEEKEIFVNKIKYEGMTVNAIGKILDYINYSEESTFVKGQLLRLENIGEDSNFAYEIYEEISKGVYIFI